MFLSFFFAATDFVFIVLGVIIVYFCLNSMDFSELPSPLLLTYILGVNLSNVNCLEKVRY